MASAAGDLLKNETGLQVDASLLRCLEKRVSFIPSNWCNRKRRMSEARNNLKRTDSDLKIQKPGQPKPPDLPLPALKKLRGKEVVHPADKT